MKGILLYAKPYSMNDNGVQKSGISMSYLLTETLSPSQQADGGKGFRPCRESLPLDMQDQIQTVPGIYAFKFNLVPGSNGKPQMRVASLQYVENCTGKK